jgi:hypothetical protein
MIGSDRIATVLMAAAVLLAAGPLSGQCPRGAVSVIEAAPAGVTQEVILTGRVSYLGRVIDAGDPVRFQLLSGDILELDRSRIECVRVARGRLSNGEFWPEDPNTTRLFFGPTGRALPRGDGYLSMFMVLMPMVAVGVTDRITLAGGTPLLFGPEGPQVMWLAPKVEVVRTPTVRGSAGVLALFGRGESGSIGVLYGVATVGATTDQALTAGAGWGYSTEDGIYSMPALMGGMETRVSRRIKLISENYLIPDEGVGLISLGTRFIGDRLAADLGVATPLGSGEFFVFPLVNFVYNW